MQGRAVLFGALMVVAATARAQGIISFDDVPIEGEPTVEINMGPEMLSLFGEAAKGAAGQAANALQGVTNVRVLVYEEPWLARLQPEAWDAYRARVPRWFGMPR